MFYPTECVLQVEYTERETWKLLFLPQHITHLSSQGLEECVLSPCDIVFFLIFTNVLTPVCLCLHTRACTLTRVAAWVHTRVCTLTRVPAWGQGQKDSRGVAASS